MKRKVVVFDWNGTILADTTPCLHAVNTLLRYFRVRPVTLSALRNEMTSPVGDFYLQHGCPAAEMERRHDELVALFHQTYNREVKSARTRRGARVLLEWLNRRGVRSCILSNHLTADIEHHLQRLKLRESFAEIFAYANHQKAMKNCSKEERLRSLAAQLKLRSGELLLIGDSPEEISAGHRLGIPAIALTGGAYSAARLKRSEPRYLAHSLHSCKIIIARHWNLR
jgi:phosphoglycolate phosphatase-like HAD superfamily hydrolase